jgi:AcrR family transcriptional regulator
MIISGNMDFTMNPVDTKINISVYDGAMTSATSSATRGRPRSSDRTDAILDATNELCRELGYDGLRMQDVADRAGAGLATIYRRWSTKPELVAAAMRHRKMIEFEPSGDPVADLRSMISSMVADIGTGDMVAGFLGAIREHEDLRAALIDSVMAEMRPTLMGLMAEIAPGAASLSLLADAVPGAILVRTALLDQELDPAAYADEVVELVLALR